MPDGKVIARKRLRWPATPSRVFRVPAGILGNIEGNDGDVTSAFNAEPRPAPSVEAEPPDPSCHQSPAGSNSPVTPTGDPTSTPTIATPGSPDRHRAFTSGGRMLSWLALSVGQLPAEV